MGLRKIVSRHLRLYTDLKANNAVDELPLVFDNAVQDWAKYFEVAPRRVESWKMQGFLIEDRAKFAALGLLPEANPDFENGFATDSEVWLMDQPSDYYRRHLLLHEGTHSFMIGLLGDTGSGWYMEGIAELLGTHRWKDGQLQLRVMPADRKDVPMWGRIKLIREAFRSGQGLDLPAVLALEKRRVLSTAEYAWSWALCKFLDSHPRWHARFRQLAIHVRDPQFNQRFREEFHDQWPELLAEWRAYISTLDYGYDTKRMAMVHQPAEIHEADAGVTIAADRGWQSTGWALRAGRKYFVTAQGRYQIAEDEAPWPCEPGGVTLEYWEGRPLGMLLGMLRATRDNTISPSIAIGLQGAVEPAADAVLYLRVNDGPAGLGDNRGSLRASIAPRPSGD